MSIRVPAIGDRVTGTGIVVAINEHLLVIRYEEIVDHGVPNPHDENQLELELGEI